MKKTILTLFLLFLLLAGPGGNPATAGEPPDRAELKGLDAVQALAVANRWRMKGRDVKTFVNAKELVFKFPDGYQVKVPLPEDRMVVAVAPYISNTHQ